MEVRDVFSFVRHLTNSIAECAIPASVYPPDIVSVLMVNWTGLDNGGIHGGETCLSTPASHAVSLPIVVGLTWGHTGIKLMRPPLSCCYGWGDPQSGLALLGYVATLYEHIT